MALALLSVILLAAANGANDNFKSVATLLGSGVADYRRALAWGTAATFAGSIAAMTLGAHLVAAFSGKLFVSAATLALPHYGVAVCLACALTLAAACRLGLPVSTTHALGGALIGAALLGPQGGIDWGAALWQVFLPLALGPAVAFFLAWLLYPLVSRLRRRLGLKRARCLPPPPGPGGMSAGATAVILPWQARWTAVPAPPALPPVREYYVGQVFGVEAGRALDRLHYLSAGLLSFARGVQDTPKIVALLWMVQPFVSPKVAFAGIGLAIALGGWWGAQRVAQTLSEGITELNPGQGLSANLITSGLVLAASPLGVPLSTTQLSCGALFGIGALTGRAHWRTIAGIVGAWMATLPLAAAIAALLMQLFSQFSGGL